MNATPELIDEPATRLFLRHTLATLAYRASKAVRGAPAAFADYRATPESPTSVEILAHMSRLMNWVLKMASGEERWAAGAPLEWDAEIDRFFDSIEALDTFIASDAPIAAEPARLFQGGIADALTHTGQLAMLRRLSGNKMQGENYSKAAIIVGRVGFEQVPADPHREF